MLFENSNFSEKLNDLLVNLDVSNDKKKDVTNAKKVKFQHLEA